MALPQPLRVAAAQYPIEQIGGWDAYRAKLSRWVAEAGDAGAQLLLFPEYGAMELTALLPPALCSDLAGSISALQPFLAPFRTLYANLAARHGVHIVAPSFPVRQPSGSYRNTAFLFAPQGGVGAQEKLVMTRFERERWGIESGHVPRVFDTALGRLAISVCYDAEFPLLVRRQTEAGADVVLVPSCTDTLAGYYRVRVACRARALESQCAVVQAPTIGDAPWSPAVDVNVGAAGVFAPPDIGLPDNGVIAEGPINTPQWVYAAIDLAALAKVRAEGQVINNRDWDLQTPLPAATVETLA